ncbi:hypothetical protein [Enterovibrio paralichthyis]|uniref:hypothetical protein n=1 Tax=Enterovibrio paralichthyis TaxID=2853805 RepID=UPI001C453B87|nr:hypothetical protein [Enterovibrio paralichthyis]MBV7296285.1 hypothetical protein [Enterovibrio paralichthyis]
MTPHNFPFSAGQLTDKTFGSSLVLSPVPVHTNIAPLESHDILVDKTESYIDIGGAGGMIFQTQQMWMLFLMSLGVPIYLLWSYGGVLGFIGAFYQKRFIDDIWVTQLDPWLIFIGVGVFFLPLLGIWLLLYRVHVHARKMLTQTLPVRFHRQRREVMFSRWNKEKKCTEYRFFPWESVCAMAGQSSAMTTGGVFTTASLLIGINSDEKHGYFWGTLQTGAISKVHAASLWEMIRTYMEDGPEYIGEPSPLTYKGLKKQHCEAYDIDEQEFGFWRHFWWAINGTWLGIWRINHETKKMKQNAETFEEVVAWSKPIPESQWAKPSDELNHYNEILDRIDYGQGRTLLDVGDIRVKYPYRPKEIA